MASKRIDIAGDDLAIEVGAGYSEIIYQYNQVTPDSNPPSFEGIDLTGYTCKAQVRREPDYEDIIIELDDYITLNAGSVNGAISLVMPSSETTTLIPGVYHYDLFLTSSDEGAQPFKLLWGIFEIRESVTKFS